MFEVRATVWDAILGLFGRWWTCRWCGRPLTEDNYQLAPGWCEGCANELRLYKVADPAGVFWVAAYTAHEAGQLVAQALWRGLGTAQVAGEVCPPGRQSIRQVGHAECVRTLEDGEALWAHFRVVPVACVLGSVQVA